jgi:NitT/TauT family transport system substrate-binding protein
MKNWLFLLAGAVLACSSPTSSASPRAASATGSGSPIRLGLVTWLGYGPFYIAQEKGLFAAQGVAVDLQRIEGDAERRAAISAGSLDGIALTLDALVVLRSGGLPLKTVMVIDSSHGGDGIVAIHAVKSVADLKGRQVAFPTGLPSHFFLYSVLRANHMSMSDIKPIVMDADKAGAAFAAGQVDVAVTWEPWLSKAREVGKGHVLADSRQYPGQIEDVLFVRQDVIAKRPDAIRGILKAWFNALDYLNQHPAEGRQIMAKAFGLDDAGVQRLLPGIRYEDLARNKEAFGTDSNPGFLYSLYDRISEAWLEEKVIKRRDTPADGLEPSFVRRDL